MHFNVCIIKIRGVTPKETQMGPKCDCCTFHVIFFYSRVIFEDVIFVSVCILNTECNVDIGNDVLLPMNNFNTLYPKGPPWAQIR